MMYALSKLAIVLCVLMLSICCCLGNALKFHVSWTKSMHFGTNGSALPSYFVNGNVTVPVTRM